MLDALRFRAPAGSGAGREVGLAASRSAMQRIFRAQMLTFNAVYAATTHTTTLYFGSSMQISPRYVGPAGRRTEAGARQALAAPSA